MTHQGKIAARQEARLMRPILHEFALTQRAVQPFGRIVAETAKQHQIRAAGNDIDGVDLQQRHALDGCKNIGGLRAAMGALHGAMIGLRGEMIGLRGEMTARLDGLDHRLDRLEVKVDDLDKEMTNLAARFWRSQ